MAVDQKQLTKRNGISLLTACCVSAEELNCAFNILRSLVFIGESLNSCCGINSFYILFNVGCVAIVGHIYSSNTLNIESITVDWFPCCRASKKKTITVRYDPICCVRIFDLDCSHCLLIIQLCLPK